MPAVAQMDRPRFAEVLATSRVYADERTFIFYCLRQKAEMRRSSISSCTPTSRTR